MDKLLSIFAGCMLALAYGTGHYWICALMGWTLFFGILLTCSTRKELCINTYLCLFCSFACSLYWLFPSLIHFGGLHRAWAVLGYFFFCSILTVPYVVLLCVTQKFRSYSLLYCVLILPITLTLAELVRGPLVLDFGWQSPAYALLDSWWGGWAPIGGEHLINFVFFLSIGCLGAIVQTKITHVFQRVSFAGILLCLLAVGAWSNQHNWSEPYKELSVRVVQPFLRTTRHIFLAQNKERIQQIQQWLEQSGRVDLQLLPESVLTVPVEYIPQDWWKSIQSLAQRAPMMLTALRVDHKGVWNTRFFFSDLHQQYIDKRKLVPFGEFVPAYLAWLPKLFGITIGNMQAGAIPQDYFVVKDINIAPLICYENLYGTLWPEWVQVQGMPHLITVSSNLGWFGPRILLQHLQMTRLRAKEIARPAVSVNNNGQSAWVDPKGHVMQHLSDRAQVVDWNIQTYKGPATLYAQYGFWILFVFMMGFCVIISIIVSPKSQLFLRRNSH